MIQRWVAARISRCTALPLIVSGAHILLCQLRSCYILHGPSSRSSPGPSPEVLAPYSPFRWDLESCPPASFTPPAASVFRLNVWSPNGDNPSTDKKANPLLQRKSYPEIVAPVPLRHHALQPELTPDAWIRTPSPSSSRAISPATPIRGGFPRGSRQHYRFASFSTVMDARVGKGGPEVPVPFQEQGFGRRWLRWMHKNGVKHWVVPCTLLASVLVRWCTGLGSYSGTLTKMACGGRA